MLALEAIGAFARDDQTFVEETARRMCCALEFRNLTLNRPAKLGLSVGALLPVIARDIISRGHTTLCGTRGSEKALFAFDSCR